MKQEKDFPLPLQELDRDELIRLVEELREDKMVRGAFSNVSDVGSNDATLVWQGRNRFLAENVPPVSIKRDGARSFPKNKGGEHRVIDGDNLAVMRSLLTEFRGGPRTGFDVIYMDPPYNTGKDTFIYNDNYRFSKAEVERLKNAVGRVEKGVSLDDPSRHTKWINHIAPRLWAARKLLKHTGVLIISIDEHELPRLWMLLEEMYGEKNRLATIIWERARKNDASYFSEGHEYILVWARDKNALDEKMKLMAKTKEWSRYKGKWRKPKEGADEILTAYAEAKREFGNDPKKIQGAMNTFFKELPEDHPAKKIRYKKVDRNGIYNDDGNLNWPGGGGPRYTVLHNVTGKACKVPASGWRIADPADMQKLIDADKIAFKKDHTGIPRMKTYLHEMEAEVATSVIRRMGQRGVETLANILGKGVFENPKDHELLAELFNLVTWRDPNALIFDPYAGSGTTGHAVLAMNAEDGGQRRFVLVENGDPSNKKIDRDEYTERLTAERLKRVFSGQWADGSVHPAIPGGFTYYEAKRNVSKTMIMESTRENLADIILQIVEEDSNRMDCRMDGYKYLIGKTRLGFGIALVWEAGKTNGHQALTREIRTQIMAEAAAANVSKPVYIYAVANVSPLNDELYRFQQIPDSILARLNLLEEEEY
ncbi:site-specific DNA-methyltransferase [Paraburkholderia sp. J11-2]|uniref:site-specific DNA-methyltransferase n=1 Tax=Paraburkholderia sp. J11-2 TaxID=2805431 RepID=UPI002AB6EF21|nr:site-specific DNA-methyltransferase [Paraburkholderia sp. J11-2]